LGRHRADWLNVCLGKFLESLTRKEEWAIKAMIRDIQTDTEDHTAEISMIRKTMKKTQKRMCRLKDLYIDGELFRDEYNSRKAKLMSEYETLKGRVAALENKPTLTKQDIKKLVKKWQFDSSWDADKIRDWLKKYVKEIVVSNDAIEFISLRIPGGLHPDFGYGTRKTFVELLGFNPRSRKHVDKAQLKELQESLY
jgi:hypothetical protein